MLFLDQSDDDRESQWVVVEVIRCINMNASYYQRQL